MKNVKAIIIDDEARARRALRALISEFCEGVEVLGVAGSVDEGLELLTQHTVDVIFLDVSMPEKDGFALASLPELRNQKIIFVTAHAEFALSAFRVSALDYLLKPVNITELREAVGRVRERLGQETPINRATLQVYVNGEHCLIPLRDIQYLQADGSYTYIVTADQRYMVSKGLRDFEKRLLGQGFYRSHRSCMINLQHIERVGSTSVILKADLKLPLSRYRRADLLKTMG